LPLFVVPQEPAIGPYAEGDKSSRPNIFKVSFNKMLPSAYRSPEGSLAFTFSTDIL
jgi:hypothetical protein